MSVIPASRLCRSDLSLLGNNLVPRARCRSAAHLKRRRRRRELAAVNRSLAGMDERLAELHWPVLLAR